MTGALCAYVFADAGVRVALVEAKRIGRGSTLASTALLMQEPDRDFGDLATRFGRKSAREIWRALASATRDLTATIRKLKIDPDFCECESVYFTASASRVAGLRRELALRKRAGLPGRWLSPSALLRKAGIRAHGAIATRGNAQANPLRVCHGFVREAKRLGAVVYERSPVKSIRSSSGRIEVATSGGTLSASVAVVATGYATPELSGRIGRFRMKDTYVLATRRLPTAIRRSRVMAWDTDRPYHYVRWTDDGRLLFGGADTVHRGVKGSRQRIARARKRLVAYLGAVHPEIGDEALEYAWEGLFAETPDGLPYIGTHSRYPNHLFALGYGGNGMTASFLAARLLLDLYQHRDKRRQPPRGAELFAFRRGGG